ncbi:hypothetical protein L517_1762, partial [Bordetella bronchiseptica MBORD670]
MRSGCLHDRPHTRRVCARREQDSAGACPHGKDRLPGFGRCLSPREGQAPRIRQVPVPRAGTGTWVCHFVFASASSCVITAAYFWRMSNRLASCG